MLLSMSGVTKDFPAGRVLHGVDLNLPAGHVHALVGENGAGKSTLMKVVAGIYPDYGGSVAIDGQVVDMASPRKSLEAGVAVIHQEFALVPDLTVAENIAMGREISGVLPGTIGRRATLERSRAEAENLGIDLDLASPASRLPVDQQQLVEIVKAVSRDARVLIMDEPTARLTSAERLQLFAIMEKLKARGVGIIYISHFLEEIFEVAETVTVLRDGCVVSDCQLSETSVGGLAERMVGAEVSLGPTAAIADAVPSSNSEALLPGIELCGVAVPGKLLPTDLSIRAGEIVALAGLPSSGRSALANAIIGNEPGAIGTMKRAGRESALPKTPRRAAAAGLSLLTADRKNAGMLGARSVADNIALCALSSSLTRLGLVRRRARRRLVDKMIAALDIRVTSPDQPMVLLSGGNQQKVLLARAIAANPDLLILDQPTVGVDVRAKAELYRHVEELSAGGMSVLLVSDDIDEILRLAHTVCVVRGPLVASPLPNIGISRARLLAAITSDADSLDSRDVARKGDAFDIVDGHTDQADHEASHPGPRTELRNLGSTVRTTFAGYAEGTGA
jgi:ribose transport system ATP-binding protein